MVTLRPALKPLICCLIVCGCIIFGYAQHARRLRSQPRLEALKLVRDTEKCQQPLPLLDSRDTLGSVLEAEQAQVGIELGVQTGMFAAATLQQWSCNKKYYLVDIWAPMENYLDEANVGAEQQDILFQQAQDVLQSWNDQTIFLKMKTTEAAQKIPNESVDYVYVDARHDYCGVAQDLEAYWPKLKAGGILAGHDFLTNSEVQAKTPEQDWSLCEDGTRDQRAVQGAVMDFAKKHNIQLLKTYHEEWPTWYARKPCASH